MSHIEYRCVAPYEVAYKKRDVTDAVLCTAMLGMGCAGYFKTKDHEYLIHFSQYTAINPFEPSELTDLFIIYNGGSDVSKKIADRIFCFYNAAGVDTIIVTELTLSDEHCGVIFRENSWEEYFKSNIMEIWPEDIATRSRFSSCVELMSCYNSCLAALIFPRLVEQSCPHIELLSFLFLYTCKTPETTSFPGKAFWVKDKHGSIEDTLVYDRSFSAIRQFFPKESEILSDSAGHFKCLERFTVELISSLPMARMKYSERYIDTFTFSPSPSDIKNLTQSLSEIPDKKPMYAQILDYLKSDKIESPSLDSSVGSGAGASVS